MDCAVRDLMLDFNAYGRAAEGQPLERRAALWRDLYEARHPDVFGHYFELWGDRGELLEPALGKLDAGKLPARGEQLMSVLRPAAARAGELLDAQSVPLHYVVMVGLFRADGWMADLEDTPTVFFCMEKLPDPGAYAGMVAHETTHLMHFAQKPDSWPDEAVGLNLLVEGLAVATARQVSPDLTPERLFIVDDFGAWLAACRVAWPRVTAELLDRLEDDDCDQYRRYFWPDWIRRETDVPERIGYLVGYCAVVALAERYSLGEMARWPAERATAELRAVLGAGLTCW